MAGSIGQQISNGWSMIAESSDNDTIDSEITTIGAVSGINVNGMSNDTEDVPEPTEEADKEQKLYLIGTPEGPSAENNYSMTYTHTEEGLEAYTTEEIDKMREVLADHYACSEDDMNGYTESVLSSKPNSTKDADGVSHGSGLGVLGQESSCDGNMAAYMIWSRSKITYQIDNQLDMSDENIEAGNWTSEDYAHMEEVIAVADACDGKGNYQDNIKTLNNMCPPYLLYGDDVFSEAYQKTDNATPSTPSAKIPSRGDMNDTKIGQIMDRISLAEDIAEDTEEIYK